MYIQEDGSDWDESLKDLQFAMNSMLNKTTGRIILTLQDEEKEKVAETIEEVRGMALSKIEKVQREQKVRYDKKHKPPKHYQRGDLVVVEREAQASGVSRKLAPKYKGPYLITEVLPRDGYVLKDLPEAKPTQRPFNSFFSAYRMKPCCGTLEEGDVVSQDETDAAEADGIGEADDEETDAGRRRERSEPRKDRPRAEDGPIVRKGRLWDEGRAERNEAERRHQRKLSEPKTEEGVVVKRRQSRRAEAQWRGECDL
ncbi:hypothetical protein J437_LFUL017876 [Ladona fulva]|uniref:Uncharacterized protein n=1 Tax=Ladona fulva TaxID=123851 RepID=A0A8K0KNZ4_LADFU|nr:hypothetical protein J437_LFUL017876 [Ladona fulva]